jgi:hypothetical protein
MHPYQPVSYRHPALRQAAAAPAPAPAPVMTDQTKKIATGAITLAVLGSATWAGFTMGSRSKKTLPRVAGYVGGIGAALLGVAVLGNAISLPQVTEFTTKPFNLQVA